MKRKKRFGPGFIDELSKATVSSGHFKPQNEDDWKDTLIPNFSPHFEKTLSIWRPTIIFCLLVTTFFLILLRLFHLQIVKGFENRQLAEGNRIQIKKIHAPRGVIYDRNEKILAANSPGFRLIEKQDGTEKISVVSREEAIRMEVSLDQKFADLEVDSIRDYPLKEVTAHILGYMGEITPEELTLDQFADYNPGDKVGRGGVEEVYEKELRGIDGGEVVEVDSSGRKVRTLRSFDPIPGKSLTLAIDADLQKLAFENLTKTALFAGSCCGAVIVENPQNGEILSLVSLPSFDPTSVELALNSSNSPILNRVLAGRYPPGSIFKIVSSLAGLASGKIKPETEILDTGVISLGPFSFANWYFTEYGKTEGMVNLTKAIQRSNDIYFYMLGQTIGEDLIAQTARKLGFGSKSGIDISGELVGVVPDNDWKLKNLGEIWFPGDTLHMAIGQGFVTVTPLEVSNLISEVAMGGKRFQPHLNLKVKPFEKNLEFKKEHLGIIKTGLALVPKNNGTAWPFFSFPVATAGKTGTAEFGDSRGRTHAWYTSYAPASDPAISVTVLVEAGGEGSSVAAPVAKEIYRWYFSEDKNNLIKDIYISAAESGRTLGE